IVGSTEYSSLEHVGMPRLHRSQSVVQGFEHVGVWAVSIVHVAKSDIGILLDNTVLVQLNYHARVVLSVVRPHWQYLWILREAGRRALRDLTNGFEIRGKDIGSLLVIDGEKELVWVVKVARIRTLESATTWQGKCFANGSRTHVLIDFGTHPSLLPSSESR